MRIFLFKILELFSRCVFVVCLIGCAHKSVSDSNVINGCKIYIFDDGRKLELKTDSVLSVGALIRYGDLKLFEINMRIPEQLDGQIEAIAIYPMTKISESGCVLTENLSLRRCRLSMKDLHVESRFSIVSKLAEKEIFSVIEPYLRGSICKHGP